VTPTLDLHDIQGGILRGYRYDTATYVVVRDPDPAGLGVLADRVRTAEPWDDKPQAAVNAALTATGLEAFGVPLDGFPAEFRAGMAARADRLGDRGHNDPGGWEGGLRGRGEGHLLVWVQGDTPEDVARETGEVLDAVGGDEVWRRDAEALPFGREHFGFSDGFAQPSVAGSGQENRPGEGVPKRSGRWRLLRPGEIVLGYEDEDGLVPPAPPAPLHRNATFMVLRKLRQNVAAWKAWLRETAATWADGDEAWLAAKVVGRWYDGTPLALAPERPQARSISALHEINAFGYGDDPLGLRCPVGAHIRRVNAREGLAGRDARTRRHRIIRRAMPYGPPLEGDADDRVDRGLVFACFNASIARQFEVVQSWCVDGNLFGLGPGERDLLAGAGEGGGGFTIPGAPPVRVPGPAEPIVTVCGGEYLYVPSVSGLRAIAGGAA
jgi:Dyp-type peroxidase family